MLTVCLGIPSAEEIPVKGGPLEGTTIVGMNVVARILAASVLLWSTAFVSNSVFGAEQVGSAGQARAMVEQAIEALKINETEALAAFNDKNNEQFHFRDLYVFCVDMSDGKFTAQLEPALIGTDAEALRLKGDPFGERVYNTLREAPEGLVLTVAYNALRPGTTSGPVAKVSFVARVGRQGCGVGYYR
jgi:hypothetical protein